jgi:hypothetical protein
MAEPHAALFDDTVIYFTFNLSAHKTINIRRVANQLLAAGIAEMVGSPTADEVRVSPRYMELARLIHTSGRIGRASAEMSAPTTIPWLWSLRHPKIASFGYLSMFKHIILRRPRAVVIEPDDERPLDEQMNELIDNLKMSVAQGQSNNAVIHAIEEDLFRPSYLETNAFVRLNLRMTAQWMTRKDDGSAREEDDWDEGVAVDAMLLLHRSGVMQLTFAIRLPANLNAEELTALSRADAKAIMATEMPEVLIRLASKAIKADESRWLGAWNEEVHDGVRWRRIWYAEPTSMVDLFRMYQDAIGEAIGAELSGLWMCYPTLYVDQTTCCHSREEWLANHQAELAHLTSRMIDFDLRDELVADFIPEDASIVNNDSFYLTVGMATVINWRPDQVPDFGGHLHRYLLVEACLRQYWQLSVLHTRLGETLKERRPNLRRVQLETINGMQEWRQSPMSYGTARVTADKLLADLSVPELHASLNESLGQMQQIQSADDSKRASSRATALALAAVIAAALLGLPAVSSALDVAKGTNDRSFSGWLATPPRALARHGAAGTWTLYLAIVVIVVVIAVGASVLPRRQTLRTTRGSERMPGMRWPWGTIEIIREPRSTTTGTEPRETHSEFGL